LINSRTTLGELASIVSGALEAGQLPAVLTGGAAVALWSEGELQSFDLDFIATGDDKALSVVMNKLGFHKAGKNYVHLQTSFFVEFPAGPVAVGQELAAQKDIVSLATQWGAVRIISPTFTVMDRLSQFYHWHDRAALAQAVEVASRHGVRLPRIAKWSATENMHEKYRLFLAALKVKKGEPP
jgi:hypothetical protein